MGQQTPLLWALGRIYDAKHPDRSTMDQKLHCLQKKHLIQIPFNHKQDSYMQFYFQQCNRIADLCARMVTG